jgi:chemosensory pili system protein ChpA (sensor histidine kinase/response regulator)
MQRAHTVVYADDDELVRTTIALALTDEGWDVHTCIDGTQVLAICEEVRPEVVLLDLNMPNLNGFEVASAIRDSTACRPDRLIAITGRTIEGVRESAIASGFDRVLFKPLSIRAIVAALAGGTA